MLIPQQLCWTCKKSCGKCPWSKNFTPVAGWEAEETLIIMHYRHRLPGEKHVKPVRDKTYKIKACPLYEKEKRQ